MRTHPGRASRRKQRGDRHITPILIRGGYINDQGRRVPEERIDLPLALFVPGVSSEEGLMSDVAQGRAQIIFQQTVDVKSSDSVETTVGGDTIRWTVEGHPKHWVMGTELVLQRSS